MEKIRTSWKFVGFTDANIFARPNRLPVNGDQAVRRGGDLAVWLLIEAIDRRQCFEDRRWVVTEPVPHRPGAPDNKAAHRWPFSVPAPI